jgi:hypothetical protein
VHVTKLQHSRPREKGSSIYTEPLSHFSPYHLPSHWWWLGEIGKFTPPPPNLCWWLLLGLVWEERCFGGKTIHRKCFLRYPTIYVGQFIPPATCSYPISYNFFSSYLPNLALCSWQVGCNLLMLFWLYILFIVVWPVLGKKGWYLDLNWLICVKVGSWSCHWRYQCPSWTLTSFDNRRLCLSHWHLSFQNVSPLISPAHWVITQFSSPVSSPQHRLWFWLVNWLSLSSPSSSLISFHHLPFQPPPSPLINKVNPSSINHLIPLTSGHNSNFLSCLLHPTLHPILTCLG